MYAEREKISLSAYISLGRDMYAERDKILQRL
jgi:hypothetical protein